MNLLRTLLLAGIVATGLTSAPALADGPHGRDGPQSQQPDMQAPHREQERAFQDTRDGRSMPLPQLERRVMPFMGGADYLGPELRGDTYRLKFMRGGRVIWVDVDAATGRIVGKSGD